MMGQNKKMEWHLEYMVMWTGGTWIRLSEPAESFSEALARAEALHKTKDKVRIVFDYWKEFE